MLKIFTRIGQVDLQETERQIGQIFVISRLVRIRTDDIAARILKIVLRTE